MRKIGLIAALLVAGGTAHAQQVQPGLWETSSKIVSISSPKIPPNVAAMMAKQPATTERQCISPADAATGFQEMLRRKSEGCTVSGGQSMISGVLDVTAQCRRAGEPMTMHMRGPFSPTGFTLNSDATVGGRTPMQMSMLFSAKRVGSCK